MIRELPKEELPRERLIKYGSKALSNEELLSIILRTGTRSKSVKELSIELLKKYNLKDLCNISYNSLEKIKGIGSVKAITLLAAIELGKRVLIDGRDISSIKCSDDVYNYVRYEMEDSLQEKFMIVCLDTRKKIILSKVLFIGTVDSSNIYARDIFREGVKCNASSIILIHNHPAGSVKPSKEDVYLTNNLIRIGKIIGIRIIDHLIIGNNRYYSFLEDYNELFK
jgi:DNA repair protein RadC